MWSNVCKMLLKSIYRLDEYTQRALLTIHKLYVQDGISLEGTGFDIPGLVVMLVATKASLNVILRHRTNPTWANKCIDRQRKIKLLSFVFIINFSNLLESEIKGAKTALDQPVATFSLTDDRLYRFQLTVETLPLLISDLQWDSNF